MERLDQSGITRQPHYLRVDFGDVAAAELSQTYRRFANLCVQSQVNGALLQAGDNDPEGHRRLGDALSAMARDAGHEVLLMLPVEPETFPASDPIAPFIPSKTPD